MSPQKGHMRWEAKSPSWGSIPSNFLSDAAMKAHRLRIRLRKGCGRDIMAKLLNSLIIARLGRTEC